MLGCCNFMVSMSRFLWRNLVPWKCVISLRLTRRRTQLLQLISQESNRLCRCMDAQTITFVKDMLQLLKSQLKSVNSAIETSLEKQSGTNPTIDIIRSVPGVGVVMTSTHIAELPELGSLSRAKIAKLVGVAPMIKQKDDQGNDGKRRARGGRGNVRRILYMAALVANAEQFGDQEVLLKLLASGKPKKLALVACMRKLLTILNDMVRHQKKWDDTKKSDAGSIVSKGPAPLTCR